MEVPLLYHTWYYRGRVGQELKLLKDETGHTLLNLKEKPSVGSVMPLYVYTSHVRVILATSTNHTPPFEEWTFSKNLVHFLFVHQGSRLFMDQLFRMTHHLELLVPPLTLSSVVGTCIRSITRCPVSSYRLSSHLSPPRLLELHSG